MDQIDIDLQKREIQTEIKQMIKDKLINKDDSKVTETLLTWMSLGKVEAQKVSEDYVKNLTENGFANENGYLIRNEEDDETIWFLLAIAGAQGFIQQTIKDN